VKSASDFRTSLSQLQIEYQDSRSRQVLNSLFPCVDHYETFANLFMSMMANAVDVSLLWGLLFLVVKASGELLYNADETDIVSDIIRN
jgi:hypothetical protein